ncbi:RNA-binding protein [Sporothrix schenckii 1099-18]|uniref:RNA-binding protein n=1 Tax=Sporothrix schenckii 1099-18 TaxID=1397361 RepID=A0A0F2MFZ2_SPOSC|nr:RNA-binding protein [Sporothrix schenckii 1099-18]KJR87081.1 RNA-binding protein [Sporothrix schenckii 1099-18]
MMSPAFAVAEDDDVFADISPTSLNRYSMPVTRSRTGFYDFSSLDQTNTTRFLFGEEEEHATNGETNKMFQQTANTNVTGLDESFPTLTRSEGQTNTFSASSTALDLALSQNHGSETTNTNGWGSVRRHRGQPSLNGLPNGSSAQSNSSDGSKLNSLPGRHSFDLKYYGDGTAEATVAAMLAASPSSIATPPKLQQSYSANDIATVKSTPGSTISSSTNNHAQQYLHNHNASLGRIPAGVMHNRHSRELSTNEMNNAVREYTSIGTALQANAAPYGNGSGPGTGPGAGPVPSNASVAHTQAPLTANALAAAAAAASSTGTVTTLPPTTSGNNQFMNGYYGGNNYSLSTAPPVTVGNPAAYGINNMPVLTQAMQGMALNGHSPMYQLPQGFNGYAPLYGAPSPNVNQAPRDNQTRIMQSRRQMENEGKRKCSNLISFVSMNRYNNTPLEAVGGTIYELCKDQHGCRYLQKQLENRIPEQVHMIWLETNQHVVELMTDPFGNYLCQKLLEYCNDEERTVLIQNAAQDMVRIALNQHGTRALQKMIEFISTEKQVQIIIEALRHRVVDLIQDLNGNHVIQKCLNKLTPANAQFIFDAVGGACVEVGTHRHGCCVLQRCIDHASGDQKAWLISRITQEAVTLIQDPFGNYVVQYIIDLNDHNFTEPLVAQLRGRICQLSRHKFSSNVVEKCLRCSLDPSKDMIVEELLQPGEIDRLLRDSFANYVIQTALDYATPYMKVRLVDNIRPHLPQIRSTPYGRRIQAKIQTYDSRSGHSSGQVTPAETSQGQIPLHNGGNHNRGGSSNILVPTSAFSTNGGANGISHRGSISSNNGPVNGNGSGNNNVGNNNVGNNVNGGGASGHSMSGRPVATYGPPPTFARGPMPPSNGVPSTGAMMPTMIPISMPPSGMGPGMPGMGVATENGEAAWL